MKIEITIQQLDMYTWRGQIKIDEELAFAVVAPDMHTVCQFVAMHKSMLDSKVVIREEEVEMPSKEMH